MNMSGEKSPNNEDDLVICDVQDNISSSSSSSDGILEFPVNIIIAWDWSSSSASEESEEIEDLDWESFITSTSGISSSIALPELSASPRNDEELDDGDYSSLGLSRFFDDDWNEPDNHMANANSYFEVGRNLDSDDNSLDSDDTSLDSDDLSSPE